MWSAGPFFSPDGAQIAYSAHLHGNTDVYVVPAAGGVPRRITWHPAGSAVVGWSPDGKDVLIASGAPATAISSSSSASMPTAPACPSRCRCPPASQGSFSPDGQSLAYQPITKWQPAWKRYAGGQTTPIWIVNLKTLDLVKVPRENSNDSNPVWVGDSGLLPLRPQRPGLALPLRHRDASRSRQVVPNNGLDLKSFQAGPGGLVYEQFGSIHLLDTATNADQAALHPDSRRTAQPGAAPGRRSARTRFRTPPSRPPAPAPSSRPTAKSSPFRPKKATPAT